MVLSKYTPSERLLRKRQAARLRQQRCRARKRQAAAAAKHQEELRKNPPRHAQVLPHHARIPSSSSLPLPPAIAHSMSYPPPPPPEVLSHPPPPAYPASYQHQQRHGPASYQPPPPPPPVEHHHKIVILSPPSSNHGASRGHPHGPPPPSRFAPLPPPQSLARPDTFAGPPMHVSVPHGPDAPPPRRVSSNSAAAYAPHEPAVVAHYPSTAARGPPPHYLESYEAPPPRNESHPQTIVVPAGAHVVVHHTSPSHIRARPPHGEFAPLTQVPSSGSEGSPYPPARCEPYPPVHPHSKPLPPPPGAQYPAVVSRASSRDDSTTQSSPETSPERSVSPKRLSPPTKKKRVAKTPASSQPSPKAALWSKEKAAIAAMLTLGNASTDEADTPPPKKMPTPVIGTMAPGRLYHPSAAAFEPPQACV